LIHDPRSYPELRSKGLLIGGGFEHFVAVSTSFTEGYKQSLIFKNLFTHSPAKSISKGTLRQGIFY